MKRTRLKPVSAKVRRGRTSFAAVYAEVDARSGGQCEVTDVAWAWPRCSRMATDHHHTRKPRRRFHAARWIVALCRSHHDDCEASYAYGRLTIEPYGDGTFRFRYVTAPSKFALRGQGSAPQGGGAETREERRP